MSDRPIIFSAPMIRALLAGRKTQTRRIIAEGDVYEDISSEAAEDFELRGWFGFERCGNLCAARLRFNVGDRLWARESWRSTGDGGRCNDMAPRRMQAHEVWYEADGSAGFDHATGKLRPSIFMPRWASRLTLLVTDVKVERLQDISEADILAEGIDPLDSDLASSFNRFESIEDGGRCVEAQEVRTRRPAFRRLWDAIHGEGAWQRNEWVAAITFSVIRANIDADPPHPAPSPRETEEV